MSDEREKYFVPENEVAGSRREHLSPSGKYKLVVSSFSTREGGWSYTRGKAFKIGSDEPIAVVDRNYSAFPFSWIEDHPNGHAFLIAGEDYQGQTVVELDTGKRRDHLGEEAEQGIEFCWSEHRFDPKSMLLVVCGCYWACPYEFRVFDFMNPMAGWPELEMFGPSAEKDDREWVEEDRKWPEIVAPDLATLGPTFVRTFQTANYDEDEDESDKDDESNKSEKAKKNPAEIRAIKTFKRVGPRLILQDEWVSEAEKKSRHEREEGRKKYEAEVAAFRASDPLYLAYMNELNAFRLTCDADHEPEEHDWHGITHDTWCPDFKKKERRWGRRIYQRKRNESGVLESSNPTIELEWAVETGPVKLTVWHGDDGPKVELFYEHSVDGIQKAFARAREEIAR